MSPTFFHYSPVWDLETPRMEKKPWSVGLRSLVLALVVLLLLALAAVVYLGVLVSLPACRDGLRYAQECANTTGILKQQLSQTQRELGEVQKQVVDYNRSVAILLDTLEKKEKEHDQTMQKKEEEHQREVQKLQQQLQATSKKLEQMRSSSETKVTSASSRNYINKQVFMFLFMLLWHWICF